MAMIAVVGSRQSGKTTAVETLVQGLTKRGYRVATVKHIPEVNFTIDTEGKDTWRHARAGASIVISVAPHELATIKKVDTSRYGLEEIVREYGKDVEIIVLEGFRKLVGQDPAVPKIVAVKAVDEVSEASSRYKPILTFVGPIPTEAARLEIPYVDVLKEPDRLVDMVDERLAALVRKRRERKEVLSVQIDGNVLPLKPFVQRIVRNTILSMVSTLKGAKIKGNEHVLVVIKTVGGE